MAVLCTKCSAEVPLGAQFCAACGTPVAAAARPPAAAPSTPPAYASVATPSYQAVPGQPIMAPPGSGSNAVKIILIIVAVFVGLGLVGAGAFGFMIWRVSRAIHSHGPNGEVSLSLPGGSITTSGASSFTSDDLGTDIYPGAQSTSGGMRMDLPSGSMVTGAYLTSDSKDAVVTFYKSKFGSNASVYDSADSAMISVKEGDQESVMVTVSARPTQNNGKTKIVIVHTKNKKTS
jgi:hypothetical protein